ncbi:hypothetical protein N9L66_00575 [Porticoccaceae bacterium]|nr:hypothetical protein [Porticoccaceae bacterium]MDB2343100.1 hypothetical protein [Porticoccaceae bacterium]
MINAQTLKDAGLPDTRIDDLVEACQKVHSAVADISPNHRPILKKAFPDVFSVAQKVGLGHEFLNTFKKV